MLYACPNVKTTTYGAKLNLPPMKAFRAPGFVEGTFGLEALLDELAAKLDLDPLELRRRNHAEHDERARSVRTAARTCSSATGVPSRTGSGATRCARARPRRSSAASGWRRRSGTAAADRPATRGSASAPTAARRS